MRDMLINSIGLMSPEELSLVHQEIGPFCLEVLLNATRPKVNGYAHHISQPTETTRDTTEPRSTTERISKEESSELIARLREVLGNDGWTEDGILEVIGRGQGRFRIARGLLSGRESRPLPLSAAIKIREFLQ